MQFKSLHYYEVVYSASFSDLAAYFLIWLLAIVFVYFIIYLNFKPIKCMHCDEKLVFKKRNKGIINVINEPWTHYCYIVAIVGLFKF